MEILFITLAFIIGFILGAAATYYGLKWFMTYQMKKMVEQMPSDPMVVLSDLMKQMSEDA